MATSEERLKQYEDLFEKSRQYDMGKFQNEFERAYGETTGYNKDLIEQQAQALGELQSVAPTLRERYANTLITDPTKQMALIAQARQSPITSWGTAANLLTARGQRYEDILGKALGAYQTEAQRAQTDAENAWRLYQDAIAREEAARGSGGFNFSDLFNTVPTATETSVPKRTYQIPDSTRPVNLSNTVQDVLAKGVTNYQNAPNLWQKYLELQKGTLGSLASIPLTGIAGPAAYASSVLPSVWNDIKGLFNRK